MLNQEKRNAYFQKFWIGNTYSFDHWDVTGYCLADNIGANEWVLDVGCGHNPFKGHIKNLVGVDPSFKEADVQSPIEEFLTEQKFDVAFVLGSINFGAEEYIRDQIKAVISHLKDNARIYWRCNPGDHREKQLLRVHVPVDVASDEEIDNFYFPWSKDYHYKFAKEFGFEVKEMSWEKHNRIYACWVR
jgi:hypothetical protein